MDSYGRRSMSSRGVHEALRRGGEGEEEEKDNILKVSLNLRTHSGRLGALPQARRAQRRSARQQGQAKFGMMINFSRALNPKSYSWNKGLS